MRTSAFLVVVAALLSTSASAQYTQAAGANAPTVMEDREVRLEDGRIEHKKVEVAAPKDHYGNARGNDFDLAVDGAFDGQTIAVIQLYTEGAFDFALPKNALREKGFSVYRWVGTAPSPKELEKALEKSCQLWLISDAQPQLTQEHLAIIKRFWEAGHGVYIWGDNQPFYSDANAVAEVLFGAKMLGNVPGDQTVGLQPLEGSKDAGKKVGLKRRHLLTTGLEYIYEGITIATLQPNDALEPLIYGSAGNLVAAYYDHGGRRAILDGGFTRLYVKWDTAGTGRYVKNAAAWLVNAEKFGTAVLGPAARDGSKDGSKDGTKTVGMK